MSDFPRLFDPAAGTISAPGPSILAAWPAPASPLLDRLEGEFKKLQAAGKDERELAALVRRLIHSPFVALLVRATPNTADDAVLALLKALFPAA